MNVEGYHSMIMQKQEEGGLPYVLLDGTMLVDTGIKPTLTTELEFKASFAMNNDNHIGTPAAYDSNDFRYIQSGKNAVWDYGSRRIVRDLSPFGYPDLNATPNYAALDIYVKVFASAQGTLDISLSTGGSTHDTSSATTIVPTTYNLMIGGAKGKYNIMRVVYFRIKQNNAYVINLTPAKYNGGNYLFDSISGQYYGNSLNNNGPLA